MKTTGSTILRASLSLFWLALPCAAVHAAQETATDAAEADVSANDVLTADRRAWFESAGLKLGLSEDRQSWIGYGQVSVMKDPGPGWGTSRLAAFDRAMAEARASFVEMTGVRVAAESLSKVFSDDGALLDFASSSPQGEDRLARIEAKLRTLAGPQLREALELLGLNASDLAALGETEKRKALQVAFTKRVATQATADMSGLRPIQTFETTKNGGTVVCVVVRWSRKDTELARLIETGMGSFETNYPGKPLKEWLSAKDEDLLDDWGIRVLPGPQKEPLVICFAQSPVEYLERDSEQIRNTKERAAFNRAKQFAMGELTFYVNASTMYEQIADRSENFEQSITSYADGFQELDLGSSSISETLTSLIRTQGVLRFEGGSVEREWKLEHPDTGTTFCGVVYVWSPSKAKLAYDFKDALKRTSAFKKEEEARREGTRKGNDYPVDF